MPSETKHTPTPWKADKGRTVVHIRGEYYGVCQISTTGYKGMTPAERKEYADRAEANAALIVTAVNSHAALCEALESVLEGLELRGLIDGWVHDPRMVDRARAALRDAWR